MMPLSLLCVERAFRDVCRCGVVGGWFGVVAAVVLDVVVCIVLVVFVVDVVLNDEGGREFRSGGDIVGYM